MTMCTCVLGSKMARKASAAGPEDVPDPDESRLPGRSTHGRTTTTETRGVF